MCLAGALQFYWRSDSQPNVKDKTYKMTQLEQARKGVITPEMKAVAETERRDPEFIRDGLVAGTIAIPKNSNHTFSTICISDNYIRTIRKLGARNRRLILRILDRSLRLICICKYVRPEYFFGL